MIGLRELFERGPVSLGTWSAHRNKRYLNRGFVGLKVILNGGSINKKEKARRIRAAGLAGSDLSHGGYLDQS